jgi:serralysin
VLDGHSLNTGFEVFVGGSGRDRLSGNGGEDRFLERGDGTGGDVISGGAGNDVLEYGFTLFNTRTRGVRVSLDGIADDGAPGEGDNVRGDIEDFFLTPHADTLIGSGLKEIVSALEGDDFIDGRGGSDKIDCDAGRDTALLYPGDVRSSGTPGWSEPGCQRVGEP